MHRHGVLHWYPNYDDDLRFEPKHDRDIIAVSRASLAQLGYEPTDDHVRVPRTFRRQVAGDRQLRLWKPKDATLRPVWICCWVHRVDLSSSRDDLNPTLQLDHTLLARADDNPSADTVVSTDVSASLVVWESDEPLLVEEEPRTTGVDMSADNDVEGETAAESSRSEQSRW